MRSVLSLLMQRFEILRTDCFTAADQTTNRSGLGADRVLQPASARNRAAAPKQRADAHRIGEASVAAAQRELCAGA